MAVSTCFLRASALSRLQQSSAVFSNIAFRGSNMSSDSKDSNDPQLVVSKDDSCIICYHPEQKFPYEHTKPLPRHVPEIREGDSEMKVQYLLEDKLNKPGGPSNWELANMFYTYKHEFRHRPGKKYSNPNPPVHPRKSFP